MKGINIGVVHKQLQIVERTCNAEGGMSSVGESPLWRRGVPEDEGVTEAMCDDHSPIPHPSAPLKGRT